MKDFDRWNFTKKKIDLHKRPLTSKGQIYWCSLGFNVGVEQDGAKNNFQRPVLVLKKYSNQIVLIAPITSKIHKGDWYANIDLLGKKSQIILNQIRPIDTKRLIENISQISENKTDQIIDAFIDLIKR